MIIKKESVMDQPTLDLLHTTFHRTDCIFLGYVANGLETHKSVCHPHSNARVEVDPQPP